MKSKKFKLWLTAALSTLCAAASVVLAYLIQYSVIIMFAVMCVGTCVMIYVTLTVRWLRKKREQKSKTE